MRRVDRGGAGLTLIELMLAMMMVSLLSLSLYACLRTAFKARDRANASIGPLRAGQVALDLISQDLESAMVPNGILAGSFLGTRAGQGGSASGSLEFYAVGPARAFRTYGVQPYDATQAGGIRKVDILAGVIDGDSRPALVRRITRNLLSPRAVQPEDEVLCRNVASFTTRYFDGTAWTETWDSSQLENALPLLVELDLVLAGNDASDPSANVRFTRVCSLACWHEPAATTGGGM